MRIFSLLAAAFGAASTPLLTRGASYPGHPGGPPHLPRGQAPARGIMGGPVDLATLGKSPSRRDRHRTDVDVATEHLRTRPDFSAQRAQESKAARSRKARTRAAGN